MCRSVVKVRPDFVRALMQPFFNNAADDLTAVVENMMVGNFLNIKVGGKENSSMMYATNMQIIENHKGIPLSNSLFR